MTNNVLSQMMQFLGSGGNPNQLLQQVNPQIQHTFQQLQNMQKTSNLNSKDFTLQYFKQQGIDPQQIMQIANMLGLK